MNLQMIDHIEKILSSSSEYDFQLLLKAGLITKEGLPNHSIINLEVARVSLPLANQIKTCGLQLHEICLYVSYLSSNNAYREMHLFFLYLMESIDFPIPAIYMPLLSSLTLLEFYFDELLLDFYDYNKVSD